MKDRSVHFPYCADRESERTSRRIRDVQMDYRMRKVKTLATHCCDENEVLLMRNTIEDLMIGETIAEIPEEFATQGLAYVRYQRVFRENCYVWPH
jgi:hypothetical protein